MGPPRRTNIATQKYHIVMAGLVPAIHVFHYAPEKEDVDARHEAAGHDGDAERTPPPA